MTGTGERDKQYLLTLPMPPPELPIPDEEDGIVSKKCEWQGEDVPRDIAILLRLPRVPTMRLSGR